MAITNQPVTDTTCKDMIPTGVYGFEGFEVKEYVRWAGWGPGEEEAVIVHQVFKTPNVGAHLAGWVMCHPDRIVVSTCECERGFPLTKTVDSVREGLEALRAVTF
ncbi:hypothetical protein [Saccharothrix sp. HUAS TT1]|uniref:hypothetical protein n=1 Tax=unclassified Saccharothrix TaxID=2593673 RepID=UPI00345BFE4C